jgi:arginyl-tRNA synthetase
MFYAMKSLKDTISAAVLRALLKATGTELIEAGVNPSSRKEFGDYQVNGLMGLAKKLNQNPRDLALSVATLLNAEEKTVIANAEVAGPGFLNLTISNDLIISRAKELLADPSTLVSPASPSLRVVVDYSSPNLAKEMHVGHLRGTIIGDAISRILERKAHEVIRQNHVGDWGTQFGMLIAYLREITKNELANSIGDLSDLENFYRKAKHRFDYDEAFAEESRRCVVQLQAEDPEHMILWGKFIEKSLEHCHVLYERLGVGLDRSHLKPESAYNHILGKIVDDIENASLLSTSDGAKCVFLPEFTGKNKEPLPVIVQKSDGGFLYATTDLAAIDYRANALQADQVLYVVDARQTLHFQQVFAVAETAKIKSEKVSLVHIPYGTMMGSDGKPFKTRSGDLVKLSELIDEAELRALELVTEKNPELDDKQKAHIAEVVGVSAVKYADLSKNRASDYVFNWETMLSFDGNTAPYLLYAYARIQSLIARYEKRFDCNDNKIISISSSEERTLLIKIQQLDEALDSASRELAPNLLCNYLYELAGTFMSFYEACPILNALEDTRRTRLAIAVLTAEALKQGLEMLGINPLKKM